MEKEEYKLVLFSENGVNRQIYPEIIPGLKFIKNNGVIVYFDNSASSTYTIKKDKIKIDMGSMTKAVPNGKVAFMEMISRQIFESEGIIKPNGNIVFEKIIGEKTYKFIYH